MKRSISVLCVASVSLAVLAAAAACGCPGSEEISEEELSTTFRDPLLSEVREGSETDQARCEAACMILAEQADLEPDRITHCSAEGDLWEAPWDARNTEVEVSCGVEVSSPGFCTGRRPQGHREVDLAVVSAGTWLAVHAHLERASVTAFTELAEWLAQNGAPRSLITRCRAAAADEVVHADLMAALASGHGESPPACEARPPSRDLLAVALHNAVEGCVHETFAAIVARYQAEHAMGESARGVFARIADDELRHAQLAWDLHAWLVEQMNDDDRATVLKAQRRALSELPTRVRHNARATPVALGWPDPARASVMARRFAGACEGPRSPHVCRDEGA